MRNEIKNLNKKFSSNLLKIFLFLYVFYAVYCALTIGIHWDIFTHLDNGNDRLRNFFSLGQSNIIDNEEKPWHQVIPGLSISITAFFTNIFPKKFQVEVLHLANLTISIIGLYGFGRFVRLIFNKHVSTISVIILATYSVFFGHMSMNPKDTVVATAYVWCLYLIFKYLQKQRGSSLIQIIIYLGFFLALGSGVRLLFISILLPVFLFVSSEIFIFKKIINTKFSVKVFFQDLLKIFLVFYLFLIMFWTDAYSNIFLKPFEFMLEVIFNTESVLATDYSLLNGNVYNVLEDNINFYIPTVIFFRTPEYILALYAFSMLILTKYNNIFVKRFENFNYKLIYIFVLIFGTWMIFLISPLPLFDGMRLFLFYIPVLYILPALIVYFILTNFKFLISKILLVILSPLIFLYIFNFLSLTPFNYIYLNNFVKYPETKFENDYLAISLNELIKKSKFLNDKNTKISICGVGEGQVKYYLKKFEYFKTRLVADEETPDYTIMTNRLKYSNDINKVTSCLKFYNGEIISKVVRNNIILSVIKKN